ncbi:MAG: toprim domain-containing protein, partial [Patescibacteria group bacterium]
SEIRKQDTVILVEGQMDLIMSHQAGVMNAVAVSGTALTPEHLRSVRRLADNLIMSFVMDAA